MSDYLVNNLYQAIQGEGVQSGVPMALLRLHGCGVGCPWCDTKETWEVKSTHEVATLADALGTNERFVAMSATEIAATIATQYPQLRWVLLTGGEPARFGLRPLVAALQTAGYRVALETSGTALGHLDAGCDWVCVSPKFDMPGGLPVLAETLANADEIKMVAGKMGDIHTLETHLAGVTLKKNAQISLQPVSQSKRATKLCIEEVLARGWRLSVQVHKYLNLP